MQGDYRGNQLPQKIQLTFPGRNVNIHKYAAQRGSKILSVFKKMLAGHQSWRVMIIGGAFICTRLLQQAESSTR